MTPTLPESVHAALGHLGADTLGLQQLQLYVDLLLTWQVRVNLISPTTIPDVWRRHILDSAQLVPVVRGVSRETVVDLGSGAGLPAIVLTILLKRRITAIESDSKKATFLRTVAAQLNLPLTVHACRIESAAQHPGAIVTARALAPLVTLCQMTYHQTAGSGIGLFPKGQSWHNEVAAARQSWDFDLTATPSMTETGSALLLVQSLTPRSPL